MNGCRGICLRLEKEKPSRFMYDEGKKFCSNCNYAIRTELRNCKCCGQQFRFTPRRSIMKSWKI